MPLAALLPSIITAGGGLLSSLFGRKSAPVVGAAATGAAGGMAGERGQENLYNINRNNANTQRYGVEQGARTNLLAQQERGAMDRAGLGLAAPGARAGQVVKGSLMSLIQPASITHPRATIPKLSGGLTPAALSPLVRSAGRDLESQAAEALRTGSDVPASIDFLKEGTVKPPDPIEDYKGPGKLETTLGTGGMIADILAALAKQGGPTGPVRTTSALPLPPEMDPISRAGLGLGG